ncbi:hypothetical protein [Maricaulis maris]|uniref:hypothetical protein n=1 Tax=Maricaulis maris TaxID=74318 RepID=UPI00292205D9|nr:hypothetical protein MACH15_29050 [Maricaulis maris]
MKPAKFPFIALAMAGTSIIMAGLYLVRWSEPAATDRTLFILIAWTLLALANSVALTIGLRRLIRSRQ